MGSGPKPGDPDFVMRYPPFDPAPYEQRIKERRYAASKREEAQALIMNADTDMIEQLLLEIKNIRTANVCLKTVIDRMRVHRLEPEE